MPATSLFRVESTEQGARFVVSPPRAGLSLVFLAFWLLFWTLIGVGTLSELAHFPGIPSPKSYFTELAAWVFIETQALVAFAHLVGRRELLVVDATRLTLRTEIFRVGRTRAYDVGAIRYLRLVPPKGARAGCLAFSHGGKTVRFGSTLDEGAAAGLLRELQARLPAQASN